MNMLKIISYTILFFVVLTACQSPKEQALKKIDALEAVDTGFNADNMANLKDAYIAFADKYPDDERAAEFLFKAAQRLGALANQQQKPALHEQALQIFERIGKNYPENHFAEEALFLSAFVYENTLQNVPKATETYKAFITIYPQSELTEEAKVALENINLTPEQIIQKGEGK